ncbi:tRNA (5-methylaminomethyl-2-thiouridine)(34)-methyltransferase MnmD [Roseovarius sp. M141]|uniref:tRNA (5-methylaminomethyl-2-thiouridine)(34)-methyltransferase MnmD n=1 Tax=Roseovarius sp. M141 TaxID=2583806 RepID=UPI0020CC3ED1|nr:tRNA (5-methylaminomethyl-2-thiouridine)(34)-methyltransferase MnmD [Roseovarius sp. M141]MCQ0093813.1 tRNA (5-methylaminomethyl-2-thiouridine)(34)-methyltransferase MnmD [Roseovarius sp. M141]
MQDQRPGLDWRAGDVPVSRRYDDPYFSLDDGLAETRHVFLDGNDLPGRFRDGFHVAELGFGTGLNMLMAAEGWAAHGAPGALHLTSFEAHPMEPADMARALAAFPALAQRAARLVAGWRSGAPRIDLGDGTRLEVIIGDARTALPAWTGRADAWFLDGFAPARNPELWQPDLMAAVAAHTVPGGTAATYTAAGHVRRALAAAGMDVARVPGYGRKRHMTKARMPR